MFRQARNLNTRSEGVARWFKRRVYVIVGLWRGTPWFLVVKVKTGTQGRPWPVAAWVRPPEPESELARSDWPAVCAGAARTQPRTAAKLLYQLNIVCISVDLF